MSQRKKRRQWTAQKKLRIVLVGMEPGVEISTQCRREGGNPTHVYSWKKKLEENAASVCGREKSRGISAAVSDSRKQELQRLRSVMAEITAENLK